MSAFWRIQDIRRWPSVRRCCCDSINKDPAGAGPMSLGRAGRAAYTLRHFLFLLRCRHRVVTQPTPQPYTPRERLVLSEVKSQADILMNRDIGAPSQRLGVRIGLSHRGVRPTEHPMGSTRRADAARILPQRRNAGRFPHQNHGDGCCGSIRNETATGTPLRNAIASATLPHRQTR